MREFGKPGNDARAANAAAMDQNDWIVVHSDDERAGRQCDVRREIVARGA
jgi:hypothetical protein